MSNNIDWKLRNAALNGDDYLVSQLISQGATVDSESPAGDTALHMAAFRGHTHVVIRLLNAGCSLEARNMRGLTPLTLAANHGHLGTTGLDPGPAGFNNPNPYDSRQCGPGFR